MYARVAWVLTALTVLIAGADVWVTSAYRPLLSEEAVAVHGFPFVTAAVVGCSAMGALIVARWARHPIGWLLCLIGFLSSISLLTEAYGVWVVTADGPGSRSLGGISGWIAALLGGQLSLAALAILFLVAPDGRLLSRRWRAAAVVTLVGYVGYAGSLLTLSPTEFDIDRQDVGPLGSLLSVLGLPFIAGGLVAAMVSMVLRLRRSRGVQRQQLRLIALSAVFIALSFVFLIVVQLFNGGRQNWISSLPLFVSYLCLPLLFAVAVLRYRLFDLDLIINRAVVLALGTIFAGVGYAGLVLAVAALLNTQTSGFWLSLLATALVALAFQPLRQRVVRLANRLAYGARALPYEALSEFSRRLTEPPSPNALLPAVAEAAGRAVSARSSTAALQVPGLVGISDVWPGPADGAPDYQVPVRQGGDTLGSIGVTMPKGRGLRPADERLLHDLADQTALAFRNAAMESELAGHVAALDRTTDALAESRRRIIAADDAARRRLEAAISEQVLSQLQPMPERLSRLSVTQSGSAATDELEQLVGETNAALESLRALTRGLFPTQLARTGLARALRSHLARNGHAVTLDVEPSADRRFPARVEAAVYFACVEAVRAGSVAARIDLRVVAAELVVQIRGHARDQIDVQAIDDRVEAAGGRLWLDEAGLLSVSIPVDGGEPMWR
jgi:signal transduction histidine kinase